MTSDEPDRLGTIKALYDVVRSAQSVADELGLPTVAIMLDGATTELKKAIAHTEASARDR